MRAACLNMRENLGTILELDGDEPDGEAGETVQGYDEAGDHEEEDGSRDVQQNTQDEAKARKGPHQRFTREQTCRLASLLKTRGRVPTPETGRHQDVADAAGGVWGQDGDSGAREASQHGEV